MMEPENGMFTSDPLPLVLAAYLFMTVVMGMLWIVQKKIRNAAIGDVGWCFGLILTVLWYATQASGSFERIFLPVMLVTLYAGRLGLHILFNRVIGKEEDARYRRLRQEWGESESAKMLAYFLLQALAVAAFSLPFLVLMWNPRPPSALVELIGLLIWGVAVAGEARADRQLAYFRADPRNQGRVCREGLWKYSRHPNYFFEWLHWCSYVVMTLGAPGWVFTWIGPIGMGLALLKISGIPRAEAQALSSRGEEYTAYQVTTNAFFPWFPRSRSDKSTQA
jgi:steroid 5-alpha reductase family enzyme